MGTIEPFQFLEEAGNEDTVLASIFLKWRVTGSM
jgi:hypothetical protein